LVKLLSAQVAANENSARQSVKKLTKIFYYSEI